MLNITTVSVAPEVAKRLERELEGMYLSKVRIYADEGGWVKVFVNAALTLATVPVVESVKEEQARRTVDGFLKAMMSRSTRALAIRNLRLKRELRDCKRELDFYHKTFGGSK